MQDLDDFTQDRATPCFDFQEENGTWSVRDNRDGQPVAIDGRPLVGLSLDQACELTSVLNRVEEQSRARRDAQEA